MLAVSWSQLPLDKPIQLSGNSFDALERALDPLPEDCPLVFGYKSDVDVGFRNLVGNVIGLLEQSAIDMFPAWLPGAAELGDLTAQSLLAADDLARRESTRTGAFAPYLCALTRTALGSPSSTAGFSREIQTEQLSRILKRGSDRPGLALLVHVEGEGPAGRDLELAADWLSRHGRMGVWMTDSVVERFTQWELRIPESTTTARPPQPPGRSVPKSGSPRADSDVECILEEALSKELWAYDREWNKTLRVGTQLTSPIRVDLVWQDSALVIEIDGDEHRAVGKYASDRKRDNMLQLRGYVTLRYTNGQVLHDLTAVLDQIRTAVALLRNPRTVRNYTG